PACGDKQPPSRSPQSPHGGEPTPGIPPPPRAGGNRKEPPRVPPWPSPTLPSCSSTCPHASRSPPDPLVAMSRTGTVAIDVGGTFTDITFADAATGATWVAKTPSTPSDLSGGFITAVRKVLALAGRAPADILHVFHGTTIATNAILGGKTPPTAVVTTGGFKYVLEIGRHDIPRHGNLYGWSKPARPVAPDRVLEVRERLDVSGAVLTPLDEAEARAAARQLAQLGVPAV